MLHGLPAPQQALNQFAAAAPWDSFETERLAALSAEREWRSPEAAHRPMVGWADAWCGSPLFLGPMLH